MKNRDGFSSKMGVIAAAAGSAIGLGNIWKFPYVTGTNGGSAFIILYLVAVVLVGLPAMLSAFIIGRATHRNAVGALKDLAPGSKWHWVGQMGILGAFLLLAFYSTVGGWTLEYIYASAAGELSGLDTESLKTFNSQFIADSTLSIFWQAIFIIATGWIVFFGVQKGIERYSKILMPMLFVIIIVLDIRALTLDGASKGIEFLFNPDFSKIDRNVILNAMGQAFFSLSVGLGTMVIYGSYIKKSENLGGIASQISVADTLIALLAGVAIFPAVFAYNIDPGAGPGLIFVALPNIFSQMPGGYFFSLIFFILLGVAALTSSISILETLVAYCVEEFKLKRKSAVFTMMSLLVIAGIPCTLSFGPWADHTVFGKTVFDLFDFTVSNLILPLGGLALLVFCGWIMKTETVKNEFTSFGKYGDALFPMFYFLVRFFAPIAMVLVFLNQLGVFAKI
ncbi:transporter (plasmid) [Fulvitalea axinellae]|uniref:Transporter n=1 Tax=Fulvitalea axinellae TaxID=1182444 RepID=A0AAU9DE33_9BACT|nr:transporter [Fulvitalea axinellae]